MSLTVLSVAYPLAPVSPDASGGAEQVLSILDAALVERGHRSIVIGQDGSRVRGELRAVERPDGALDEAAVNRARSRHLAAIEAALGQERIDVVHVHGIDFHTYLPGPGTPLLATLHLPPSWYPADALRPARAETWLHCVSQSQQDACPPSPNLLAPIPNGIDVEALQARHARRGFALFLGRICPEKGVHVAIEAARRAGLPLLIAGAVFPYPEHQRYFAEAVRPHLGPGCRFLGPVGFARKRRLTTAARCLLIPSLAPETSSLVAREAAACGTAAIAFRAGALPEAVEHGRTGFLVDDVADMAAAIARSDEIDPDRCRAVARRRFSKTDMVERYLAVYGRLAGRNVSRGAA